MASNLVGAGQLAPSKSRVNAVLANRPLVVRTGNTLQSTARSPPRSRTGALARQARSMCSSASRACWAARSASSWPVTCASGTLAGVIPPRAPARCPGRAARAACTVDPQAAGLAAAAYLRVLDADASILGHPAGKRRRPVLVADPVVNQNGGHGLGRAATMGSDQRLHPESRPPARP
jgi:hypothetical protein